MLLYNIATAAAVTGVTIDTHGFPELYGARLGAA